MIPAASADAGGVAEPALHFVSERDRGDHLPAARANAFAHRENGCNVIARMRRFFGEISVVVIEIANAAAGRESSPVRRRLVIGPDNGRAVFGLEVGGDFSRDRARLFVPRPEGAAEGIDHPSFPFVHPGGREILVNE